MCVRLQREREKKGMLVLRIHKHVMSYVMMSQDRRSSKAGSVAGWLGLGAIAAVNAAAAADDDVDDDDDDDDDEDDDGGDDDDDDAVQIWEHMS